MTERNTRVRASQIRSIFPNDIEATNALVDNYVPSYDLATGKFTWVPQAGGGAGSSTYSISFVNGDLSSAYILVVAHNLGVTYPIIEIYDNNDKVISPDDIDYVDSNTINIDLSSFAPLTGTWNVRIVGGEGTLTYISDTDSDTKIQVEESIDEDIIRFDVLGTENLQMTSTGITGNYIKDEDTMVSDSAQHLATQQSIKAYVDSELGGIHSRQHAIDSTFDHTSIIVTNNLIDADANGLPDDSGLAVGDVSDAITKKHSHTNITELDLIIDEGAYIKKDGSRAFTSAVSGISPTANANLTTKEYVDGLIQGLDWQDSTLGRIGSLPSSGLSIGDRYILTSDNKIYEWNGSSWDSAISDEGFATWVEDEDVLYVFNGSTWIKFGSTVDHGNLLGLVDDDHIQYLLANGTRNLSGDLDPNTDNAISLGDGTHRYANIYGVNVYAGDICMKNDWRFTEHDDYGVILLSPEGKKYKFNLEKIQ